MQEKQQQPVASKRALSRLIENVKCLLMKKGMLGKAPISKRQEQKIAARQPRLSCG